MRDEKEFMRKRVFGKLFWFVQCDGRDCQYKFHAGDLRFGRETVGRGHGFYCLNCFEMHCPGRSWDKADPLLSLAAELFASASIDGVVTMVMEQTGND